MHATSFDNVAHVCATEATRESVHACDFMRFMIVPLLVTTAKLCVMGSICKPLVHEPDAGRYVFATAIECTIILRSR